MQKMTREERNEMNRKNILHTAIEMFLEKGYQLTTIKELCAMCNISIGSFINLFECKENLMRDIVRYVLEAQFEKTESFLKDIPHDSILMYAAEMTSQLYMAESCEHIRELYSISYSLPHTTEIIISTDFSIIQSAKTNETAKKGDITRISLLLFLKLMYSYN